jgi:hypothetical protein
MIPIDQGEGVYLAFSNRSRMYDPSEVASRAVAEEFFAYKIHRTQLTAVA